MLVNEKEEVIIFNEEELKALDTIRDMVFQIIFDIRNPSVSVTINDVLGELWEMRRKDLDRITL